MSVALPLALDRQPPIYFYISHYDRLLDCLPETADTYLPDLKDMGISDGEYCWVLQSYLHLKANGFPCQLVGKMPDEGIVLVHRSTLPFEFRASAKLLVICLKADKPFRPYAPVHVVQNYREAETLPHSYCLPHWTQPGLIARDPQRGDRFERVGFCGTYWNLAPQLQSSEWVESLQAMGLEWIVKPRSHWHDFSDLDAVLAVRRFQPENDPTWADVQGEWKPATKLYNAWQAGVPAILGREPGFQEERRTPLDYLEVDSLEQTLAALETLKQDVTLRQEMVRNGKLRARDTVAEVRVRQWREFLLEVAVPAYWRWRQASPLVRQGFFARQYWSYKSKAWWRRLAGS